MHTFLDLRGNIPAYIHITDGKPHRYRIEVGFRSGAVVAVVLYRPVLSNTRLRKSQFELIWIQDDDGLRGSHLRSQRIQRNNEDDSELA